MKKLIHVLLLSGCLVIGNSLYSQARYTEPKCYSFEKNKDGELVSMYVKIAFNENRFIADYEKHSVINGNTEVITFNGREGVLEQDKIIFDGSKETGASNTTERKQEEVWNWKGESIVVDGETLRLIKCN